MYFGTDTFETDTFQRAVFFLSFTGDMIILCVG